MTLEKGLILSVSLLLAVLTAAVLTAAPERPEDTAVGFSPAEELEGSEVPRPTPAGGGDSRKAEGREAARSDGAAAETHRASPAPRSTGAPRSPTRRAHVVRAGDRLVHLAARYLGDANAWRRIVAANPGLDPRRMRPGRVLRIPRLRGPARDAGASGGAVSATASGRVHVVRSGEILGRIARRYYGRATAWDRIRRADGSPVRNPDALRVGERLRIP